MSTKTLNSHCPGDSKQMLRHNVGRVGSSEGTRAHCPLYSSDHYLLMDLEAPWSFMHKKGRCQICLLE